MSIPEDYLQHITTIIANNQLEKLSPFLIKLGSKIDNFKNNYDSKKSGEYQRNVLVNNNSFELVLINWSKGSKTDFHYHDQKKCWMVGIQGMIKEKRVLNSNTEINNLYPGEIIYIDDSLGKHQIISSQNSITLHLYVNN